MLGSKIAEFLPGSAARLFGRYIGIPDFHSHLRLQWIFEYSDVGAKTFYELGCGSGFSIIEIALRNPDAFTTGYELEKGLVEQGNSIIKRMGLSDRVSIRQADLDLVVPPDVKRADYVLLIDVLEHLQDPVTFARKVSAELKPGARLLISVPTPLFPKVFGRRFHIEVGHLHEGFDLEQVDEFFADLKRNKHRYSTGPMSWPGIWLFYRLQFARKFLPETLLFKVSNAARILGSVPFRFVDWWNGKSISCSLFIEYERIK